MLHDKGENVKKKLLAIFAKKYSPQNFQLQVQEESHITEKEFPFSSCSKKFKS
jgi:hypothetical protein